MLELTNFIIPTMGLLGVPRELSREAERVRKGPLDNINIRRLDSFFE